MFLQAHVCSEHYLVLVKDIQATTDVLKMLQLVNEAFSALVVLTWTFALYMEIHSLLRF